MLAQESLKALGTLRLLSLGGNIYLLRAYSIENVILKSQMEKMAF